MNRREQFQQHFGTRYCVLPVIHVTDRLQTRRNLEIVEASGVHGAFLINHDVQAHRLSEIAADCVEEFPRLWLGVNFLDLEPLDALDYMPGGIRGLWVDNAGIYENREQQPEAESLAMALKLARNHGRPELLYFGGVAFKYQATVDDLEKVTRIAMQFVDVITTSGPGTGYAADPSKIRRMRQAAPIGPLAIASGITPENVTAYSDADAFLVATGVSHSHTELNPAKLNLLVERTKLMTATSV